MCPSKIRPLQAIVEFRRVFLLPKFKSFCCFITILVISLKSRSWKNGHFVFIVGISRLEPRNIMLVNRIISTIEEHKLISENMKPNVIRC